MSRTTKLTMLVLTAACSLGLAACDKQVDGRELGSLTRAGKADFPVDRTLSCAGACGDLVAGGDGYCGCDDACTTYDDCCDDRAAACTPQPTCEQAGGKCGALTASGVRCPDGFAPDGDAGSCMLGGGCCMPSAQPKPDPEPEPATTCEQAGGQCGALTASGVSCPDGFVPDGEAGSCMLGGGCCMPATEPEPATTCEQAGGQCGALTASGVSCPDGFVPDGEAGTCALGGGCCMPATDPAPATTCEQAGGQCGALTASGVSCPAGYTPDGDAGTCALGGGCCMPAPTK